MVCFFVITGRTPLGLTGTFALQLALTLSIAGMQKALEPSSDF
jgi:hypothetical protein